MRSTMLALSLAAAAALPLSAQAGGMGGMRMGGDPTSQVMGSGKLPEGWMMKIDAQRGGAQPPATAVSFITMAGGYHVKSGPAAVYYNTKDMGSGQYAVTATFKQAKSMAHEAFGIFIGGHDMQDSSQNYLYFVIKPADGTMLIAHRKSWAARTTAIVPENAAAPEAAINRDSPTDGSATNTLMIHVAQDTVHFMINGKLVKAIAKSQLDGASTDGQAGIRINHNIDMHIDGWSVKK
ncbi:MAG TPA: hypothetical protein VGM77_03990 [Gemmatimonadales bacterium]|jgi:hypothetical protein